MADNKRIIKYLINIEDIRVFHGVLTGKTVKPIGNKKTSLKKFSK